MQTSSKRFTPTCNYKEYIKRLSNSHINLLPLRYSEFNRFKSDLKYVETAGCNAVAIASSTIYSTVIKHELNGYICDEGKEVLDTLKMLGNQPSKAEEIAYSARKWCSENRLQSKQAEERLKWYQSLWDRRRAE